MAQASGAQQREPSMEEILASIRRIIEDGDSTRRIEDETERLEAVIGPAANDVRQVEAFRAELRGPVEPAAASRPQAEPVALHPASEPVAEEQPAASIEETFRVIERDLETALSSTPHVAAPAETPSWQPAAEEPEQPAAAAEAVPAAGARGQVSSLVSERAGMQVAAAFGELAEAYASNRRREMDQMAENLLRPMLQEWMDNNLPTLVERLVREEIERIARGG